MSLPDLFQQQRSLLPVLIMVILSGLFQKAARSLFEVALLSGRYGGLFLFQVLLFLVS
jgi:hypothetical protein